MTANFSPKLTLKSQRAARLIRLPFFIFAFSIISALSATAESGTAKAPRRPVVALVLEGGGAKGFAYVGVMKVLEELHVPVDIVVGTSMGSIVGAAYASGRTVAEMEDVLSSTNWDALFNETTPRRHVHFRQKAGRDRELFGDEKIGILEGSPVIPTALIEGQNVGPMFQQLFGKVPNIKSFDELPVRYRAVAADLETGEAVVIDHGSLATAARASMSVPGFFTPVELEGRLLVDGGVTNNLPVDVALALGADIIIALEAKDRLATRQDLNGPLAISGQILNMLLERTTQKGLALLRPQDLHMSIELGEYGSSSFNEAKAIMKIGEETARTYTEAFRKLAVSPEEFQSYYQKRTGGGEFTPVVDYVRVEGVTGYDATELEKTLEKEIGKPLDRKQLTAKLTPFLESGNFSKITYDTEIREQRNGVVVNAVPKKWLKNYVRMGFSLEDNFEGQNNYRAAFETRLNQLNEAGGYADFQFEAGNVFRLFSELYQPIAPGSRFFVAPELDYSRRALFLNQAGEVVAQYQREQAIAALKGGYSLGRWGELSAGWRRGDGNLHRQVGDPKLPNLNFDIGELFARLALDQLDNSDFPTEGFKANLSGLTSRDNLGSNADFEQSSALLTIPISHNNWTLLSNAELLWSSSGAPVERYLSLGGFFDVSGYPQGSLQASDFHVFREVLFYRIAEGGSALFPFGGYIGTSLEFSSLRSDFVGIPDHSNIVSGSVFVGADTPVLPVYLGYGRSDEDADSFYLSFGKLSGRRR